MTQVKFQVIIQISRFPGPDGYQSRDALIAKKECRKVRKPWGLGDRLSKQALGAIAAAKAWRALNFPLTPPPFLCSYFFFYSFPLGVVWESLNLPTHLYPGFLCFLPLLLPCFWRSYEGEAIQFVLWSREIKNNIGGKLRRGESRGREREVLLS